MERKGRDYLLALSVRYDGDWEKIYHAVTTDETIEEEEVNEAYSATKCNFLTIIDKEYPEAFKSIFEPPFVIYYYGNIELLLSSKLLGVVGARDNSAYGEKMTCSIIKDLVKEDYVIVSGMARGVDTIAHLAALENKGKTIAVLGSGIDYPYPRQNTALYERIKKDGLVISEYPLSRVPESHMFPERNRLVAAANRGVLLVEGKARSGTLITTRLALDFGRTVFCLPRNADEENIGNDLIKDGAILTTSAQDIINN